MWNVVANLRSDHIYIKEQTQGTLRAVAMIPKGRVQNTERAMKDAELIAKAPQMAQLLAEIRGEGYLSYSLEKKINKLLGDSDGN